MGYVVVCLGMLRCVGVCWGILGYVWVSMGFGYVGGMLGYVVVCWGMLGDVVVCWGKLKVDINFLLASDHIIFLNPVLRAVF